MEKLSLLFKSRRLIWFWTLVRIYLGWIWLEAGWQKVMNPAWVGADAGVPLAGFIKGALAKTAGAHPDVSGWYAWFLSNVVSNNMTLWSNLVAFGELLVGVGLILGILTAWSAFFGSLMNFSYLLAGTISTNPVMLVFGLGILAARRLATVFALDRYLMSWWQNRHNHK